MASPRSLPAMALWSISVKGGSTWAEPETSWVASSPGMRALSGLMSISCGLGAVTAEERDLVFADLGPELGIVDAEALFGRQAEHTDLALVEVVVHLVGGL